MITKKSIVLRLAVSAVFLAVSGVTGLPSAQKEAKVQAVRRFARPLRDAYAVKTKFGDGREGNFSAVVVEN